MEDRWRKLTGVRLGIAIQVFTTLLILALGYFAIEWNFRDLIREGRPISPFQLKVAVLNLRVEVLVVAFVAFLSGLILTFTIRREVKRAIEGVRKISLGVMEPTLPEDLSQEFVPLSSAIHNLAASLNRFVQRSLTDAIVLVHEDLTIDVLNPAAELLLGYRSDDLSGKPLHVIFPEVEANVPLYRWLREGVEEEEDKPGIATALTKKGEWLSVRVSTFQFQREGRRLRGVVAGLLDAKEWRTLREEFDRADRFSTLGLLVSGLAHEIKNPLGSIQGLIQMLAEDVPLQDPKRAYYDTVLAEVKRLDEIMKRLLDLSSPGRWRFQDMDLGEVVAQVGLLWEPEAKKRGVRLSGHGEEGPVRIHGDPHRIKQALINVVKNAVEATPRGGEVEWSLQKEDRWAVFSIENPGTSRAGGIGSPPFRVGASRKLDGSGLGLAITHQILHHHGGRLLVENRDDGKVCVRFMIPLHGYEAGRSVPEEAPNPGADESSS